MKKFSKLKSIVSRSGILIVFALVTSIIVRYNLTAFAQAEAEGDPKSGLAKPIAPSGVPIFERFTDLFLAAKTTAGQVALYVAVIYIIVAGFFYIIARGNEQEYTTSKNSLIGIGIGLGIIGLSSAAITAISTTVTSDGTFGSMAWKFWTGVLQPVVSFLRIFSIGWAVLFFVIAGMRLITSQGNPDELKKVRDTFMYGLVGLLVIGMSETIAAVFSSTTKLEEATVLRSELYAPAAGLRDIMVQIAQFLGPVAIGLTIVSFVIAGIKLASSGGNPDEFGKARNAFLYGVIGLLFVGMSKSIVDQIGTTDIAVKCATDPPEATDPCLTVAHETGKTIAGILEKFADFMTPVAIGWAVVFIVYAGMRLISSGGNEEEFSKARRSFIYGLGGLLFIGIAKSTVRLLAGSASQGNDYNYGILDILPDENASELGEYVDAALFSPLMKFFISFMGAFAILMFVKAGFDFFRAQGDSGKVEEAKNEIKYGITGLLIIGLAESAVRSIFTWNSGMLITDAKPAVTIIFQIINFTLSFLGAISILMFVYAGFLFITDAGDGARKKRGQDIIQYTTIGILVIIFSFAITNIFVTGGEAYI